MERAQHPLPLESGRLKLGERSGRRGSLSLRASGAFQSFAVGLHWLRQSSINDHPLRLRRARRVEGAVACLHMSSSCYYAARVKTV